MLQGDKVMQVNPAIYRQKRREDPAKDENKRDSGGPCQLWIPQDPRIVASGRLEDKPQASLPHIQPGRADDAGQEAQAPRKLQAEGRTSEGPDRKRELEHGLHVGSALYWTTIQGLDDSG